MITHQHIIENKSFNKSCLPIWITEKRAKWEWPSVSWLGLGLPQLWGRRHHQLSIPPSMITIASIPLFDLELIAPPATTVPPWSHLGATLPQLGPQDCLVARPQMDSGSIKGQLQSDAWDPGRLDSASSSRAFKMIKGTADQGVECFGWNGYFNKPHKNC